MTKATTSYHDHLISSLADPVEAKAYLNAVLEDYPEEFLKALRNVAKARRMADVARKSGMPRESLYRALSEEGNPSLQTLTSILEGMDLRIKIAVKRPARKPGKTPLASTAAAS